MYRNIALLVTALGLVMISGCAELDQLQVNRGVQGNVFSSTSPRLELRIDPGLKLMAEVKEDRAPAKNSIRNDPMENASTHLSYIFGDESGDAVVRRGVIIRTRTVTGNPNQVGEPDLPEKRNELVSGMTKILGDEYQHYAVASDNLFTEQEQRALTGRDISGCLLVKGLERNFGLGNKSLVQILYFERIPSAEVTPQCGSWQDPSALTDEQDRFLAAFLDRSYQGVRFVKGSEVTDATVKYVDREKKGDAEAEKALPPAAPDGGDIEKRLQVLKNLRDKDLITQDEYERKKLEILEGL